MPPEQDEKIYNDISKYLSTQYITEDLKLVPDGFLKYVYSEGDYKKMQNEVQKNLLFDKNITTIYIRLRSDYSD